jgi:hypothetical protein
MLENAKIAVWSVFLALGLLGGDVYGLSAFKSDVQQGGSEKGMYSDTASSEDEEDSEGGRLWRCLAFVETTEELLGLLNEFGVDLTCRHRGQTIIYAIRSPALMEWVLGQGQIDINSRDDERNTALHCHVEHYLDEIEPLGGESAVLVPRRIIALLIEYGANPFLKNSNEKTARGFVSHDMTIVRGYLEELDDSMDKETLEDSIGQAAPLAEMLYDAERKWIRSLLAKHAKDHPQRHPDTTRRPRAKV